MKKFKTSRLPSTFPAAILVAALFGVAPGSVAAEPVTIVALGDSLTAGYGLNPGESFPEQLQAALNANGMETEVINAGVSGDTSSGGLARLEWSVPPEAAIVIVELGANDALRGIDPAVTRNALSEILAKIEERGQAALLAGMRAPGNLGDEYAAEFNAIYPELAAEHGVPLYPFFLEGLTPDGVLNQSDGMHPSAAGVPKIVEGILPEVEKLVASAAAD